MEKDCIFVRELLPLYRQNLVNPQTREQIRLHLDSCPVCAQKRQSSPSAFSPFRKYHKVLKFFKIILLVLLTLLLISSWLLFKLLFGGPLESSNSIADYGQLESFQGYSGLAVFPKQPSQQADYFYSFQDTLSPTAQIYLECRYDRSTFDREKKRLSQLQISCQGTDNHIRYDTEHFPVEAYVAQYNWQHCYEYALVFENTCTIVYIFLQNTEPEQLTFPQAFLPADYESSEERFNLYAFGYNGNLDSCVIRYE